MFEQYAAILQQRYPSLSVSGDNYPPPYFKMRMAQALVSFVFLDVKCEVNIVCLGSFENAAHHPHRCWHEFFPVSRPPDPFSLGVDPTEQILFLFDDILSLQCN